MGEKTKARAGKYFLTSLCGSVYNSTMAFPNPLQVFQVDNLQVRIYASREELGAAAAQKSAELISHAIKERGLARVIAATGNSQIPLVENLTKLSIDWRRVELFHMDEYIGISANHPSSFRYWIRKRIEEQVRPGRVFYLAGDAPDLSSEIKRYSELLLQAPIDLAFVGFGENGHIAFNDPSTADFNDPATVKEIVLDQASRRQQVDEGHFENIASVPARALTITCPGLFRARSWVCCVPERRKAEAVMKALKGPISEACPASLVRRHPNAYVFLDLDSASLLSKTAEITRTVTRQPA
jgi:glucosamine-6-phosphate deaminase